MNRKVESEKSKLKSEFCCGRKTAIPESLVGDYAFRGTCKYAYDCEMAYSFVKKSAISSACFKTVSIAFACLSGG